MRIPFLILVLFCYACGGSLSDEQRKRIREQMDNQEIKKISDVEITEAAFAKGREVMNTLIRFENDSLQRDSVIRASEGRIRWLVPGAANALDIEQQLIEAYIAAASGQPQDNVQEIRTPEGKSDSLLYTKPVVVRMPDGSERVEGVWNIWLSKKELILSMSSK